MWYKNIYRRHLCDMHIDDWADEFLSEFSTEEYFKNLKTAKIQSAMLYFQSHVGLCYYPTKSGKMHNAFVGREDMMRKLARLCRENGVFVTGYYSLIYNNWAYKEHPEWRMVPGEGETDFGESEETIGDKIFASNTIDRYGLCCPNNREYRQFISEQMKEMCEYFEFDGMFFDMLFWPKMCRCHECRRRFKEETGYELPKKENWKDPVWRMHIAKRREWMGKFAQSVTDELKSYKPNASVEHNCAFAVLPDGKKALGEDVLNACDYVGGDLYGTMYDQSFTCKFYQSASKNQPFEYMLSRCEPNLSKHTITKSDANLLSAAFLTAAHHGANFVIDAIDPKGTLDKRFYERLGSVFSKTEPYEKYFTGETIADVGIYYSHRSKFNAHNEPYSNHSGAVNSTRLMIENNILCAVCGGWSNLKKYKMLIAPCLTEEDEYDNERIIDYVKDGGSLYISGGDCGKLLKEFFGAEIKNRSRENVVYIAPKNTKENEEIFGWFNEEYPLQFDGRAPIAEGMKGVIATITLPHTPQDTVKFVSIHSNPPGVKTDIPAIAVTQYGKGKVLWSALPIENVNKPYQYGEVFVSLLKNIFNFENTVLSDAPKDVEVTVFGVENEMSVCAVQICEELSARRVEPFEICIKTDKQPKKFLQLPEETECGFDYEDGYVKYEIDKLKIFDMKKLIF